MTVVYLISIIIAAYGIGVYISFSASEGKDERGKEILARGAQISFGFIFLGFSLHLLFIEFFNPTVEQLKTTMIIWMSLVFLSNGITIHIQRRKMI